MEKKAEIGPEPKRSSNNIAQQAPKAPKKQPNNIDLIKLSAFYMPQVPVSYIFGAALRFRPYFGVVFYISKGLDLL